MSDEIFSVSDLNRFIHDVLNAGFPRLIWITGEIQQYNRNRFKRHVFFDLVEKDEHTKDVKAKIGLVVFANRKAYIEQLLKSSENAFELKDDIEVKFACKVDFYEPHGAVRLVVENIDPVYTLGKLAQEKQRLIALLKEKGTLDKNKQTALSLVPLKIGLITSDDSAACHDFLSELKRSGFAFEVRLRNTIMQGRNCEGGVCSALDELAVHRQCDVIVITRGGGSVADLSAFDSRLIAEKIAAVNVPVLTGIGHEIDLSIADLAAHTYAKTPTAIARFLIQRVEDYLQRLDNGVERLLELSQERVREKKNLLHRQALRFQEGTRRFLKDHREQLIRCQEVVRQRPLMQLKKAREGAERLTATLPVAAERHLREESRKIENIEKVVDILHPRNTIKRGFSIARTASGKAIKSIKDVRKDDILFTEVVDGMIESQTIHIKEEASDGRDQIQQGG